MSDTIWTRDEVESPCVKLCVVDPTSRLCIGCKRSIDEISRWSGMGAADRAVVLAALPDRVVGPRTRRGGRAVRVAGP